jgi:predicted permease
MIGRTLGPVDEGNTNVVVLGFEAWSRIFHADPDVVGRQLPLSGGTAAPLTVVGVLPPRFEFPTGSMDFYRPFDPSRPSGQITLIARLRSGIALGAAMDEANVIGTALRPPRPANAPPLPVPRFEVQRLKDEVVKELRPALRVLLATVALVLMIVCANMANLLLARGTARQREMAVRAAIGAGRGRLVRQVLTECLLLAVAGGVVGALIGAAGVALVKDLATIEVPGLFRLMFGTTILPRGHEVAVDVKVFGVAFSIAAVSCLLFGLLPALQLSRTNHAQAMASRTGPQRNETRLRSVLVVGQLTIATVLLVGAGLLINSFVKLTTVEKGYNPSNVIAMQLLFPGDYPLARKAQTIDTVLERLRSHPQVQSAGFSRAGVLIGEEIHYGTFVPRGRSLDEVRAEPDTPRLRSITAGFLPAMDIRFLSGRDISDGDFRSALPAIVINRRAAAVLFRERNPVGEIVDWHFNKFRVEVRVVGVVEALRNESLDQDPFPEVFVDYRHLLDIVQRLQVPIIQQDSSALGVSSFAVRTRGEPEAMIPEVSRIVRAVDANAGIDAIVPLERLVTSSVTRQRFYAVMLGVFASIAAVLSLIGIYGVLAYAVARRTQEIGVRMALGAERRAVLALMLRQGLLVTAVGIGLGLLGAAAATRVLATMLFGVTPADVSTFVAVSLAFALVAMCASYVPAQRATKVNPIVALRAE